MQLTKVVSHTTTSGHSQTLDPARSHGCRGEGSLSLAWTSNSQTTEDDMRGVANSELSGCKYY